MRMQQTLQNEKNKIKNLLEIIIVEQLNGKEWRPFFSLAFYMFGRTGLSCEQSTWFIEHNLVHRISLFFIIFKVVPRTMVISSSFKKNIATLSTMILAKSPTTITDHSNWTKKSPTSCNLNLHKWKNAIDGA